MSAPDAAAGRRRATAPSLRGRVVGARVPDGPVGAVALGATVRAAAARRSAAPLLASGGPATSPASDATPSASLVEAGDLRQAVRVQRRAHLVVVAVDASGSMGAEQRMSAAKTAVLSLLVDAYQRRDLVALVAFRGDGAEVVLRPTGSVEVARARLESMATGGLTPLADGIALASELAMASGRQETHRPLLIVITDGRATAGPLGTDPVAAAELAADRVRQLGLDSVVIDVEDGPVPLGLARRLAGRMGAVHLPLPDLTPERLRGLAGRAP